MNPRTMTTTVVEHRFETTTSITNWNAFLDKVVEEVPDITVTSSSEGSTYHWFMYMSANPRIAVKFEIHSKSTIPSLLDFSHRAGDTGEFNESFGGNTSAELDSDLLDVIGNKARLTITRIDTATLLLLEIYGQPYNGSSFQWTNMFRWFMSPGIDRFSGDQSMILNDIESQVYSRALCVPVTGAIIPCTLMSTKVGEYPSSDLVVATPMVVNDANTGLFYGYFVDSTFLYNIYDGNALFSGSAPLYRIGEHEFIPFINRSPRGFIRLS